MNFFEKVSNYIWPDTPSQMWGRVYDLRKKKLVKLENFGLNVMPNDYIGRSILESKQYESHVTKVIKDTLRPNDVFLDVGGNVGYFTMLASSIVGNSGGKVIVIEPNPQNLQLIFSSIDYNKFTNIKVFPLAASDSSSILKFTTVGSNGGVVTPHSKDQKFYFFVQAIPLDIILNDEARIDLIKIDIEAHEPFALKGMENTLKRLRPKIITEFHPWAMELNNTQPPADYLKQLQSYGYSLSIISVPSGALIKDLSVEEIIGYWRNLGQETAHLDLLATPNKN